MHTPVGWSTFGHVSMHTTEVHCLTLFYTGAGGAGKSNEAIVFTRLFALRFIFLGPVHTAPFSCESFDDLYVT
ncbi:hypothetical protein ANAPC5_01399 [Anaplasma phagocytophilum]|nr:hypothetical protein ANAPC5_01399 [Anaplasma phagocytophilum]